jgi:hypothetical protein
LELPLIEACPFGEYLARTAGTSKGIRSMIIYIGFLEVYPNINRIFLHDLAQ